MSVPPGLFNSLLPDYIMRMIIAVTYNTDTQEIDQSFGTTKYFKLYDSLAGTTSLLSTEGTGGHANLIPLLAKNGVKVVIAGGMGERAKNLLTAEGILPYAGNSGAADQAYEDYMAGKLIMKTTFSRCSCCGE